MSGCCQSLSSRAHCLNSLRTTAPYHLPVLVLLLKDLKLGLSASCLHLSKAFLRRSMSRARCENLNKASNARLFSRGWPMLSSIFKLKILFQIPASLFQSEGVGFNFLCSSISFFEVFSWRVTWSKQTGHLQSNPWSFLKAVFLFLWILPNVFTSLK